MANAAVETKRGPKHKIHQLSQLSEPWGTIGGPPEDDWHTVRHDAGHHTSMQHAVNGNQPSTRATRLTPTGEPNLSPQNGLQDHLTAISQCPLQMHPTFCYTSERHGAPDVLLEAALPEGHDTRGFLHLFLPPPLPVFGKSYSLPLPLPVPGLQDPILLPVYTVCW